MYQKLMETCFHTLLLNLEDSPWALTKRPNLLLRIVHGSLAGL